MSGIYGNFSQEDVDKFSKRKKALCLLSESTVNSIVGEFPKLKTFLCVSYPNINIVVGRYINDRKRLKALHNIHPVHRSKIVSHMIKWIRLNPVIVTTASSSELNSCSPEEENTIYNANIIVIATIVSYFFEITSKQKEDIYRDVLKDLIRLMINMDISSFYSL